VLVAHNGVSIRESGGLRSKVAAGDEIRILQAILAEMLAGYSGSGLYPCSAFLEV
jgi:hypothetical protein